MGKKGLRKAGAAGLDSEERMALEEEDEFAKELAAAEEIRREQTLAGGGAANMNGYDDEDDEDEDDETALQPRLREFLNNQNGLRQVLVEIETQNGPRPWPETMEVCQFPLGLDDVHDDLARETAFYRVALAAVKEGRARLAKHNVPYKRPEDFFCDMLKSDDHMARVKDRLLFEQKKITAVEERRKQQENRKFSKALKSHKAKEKTEDKKRTLDAVKQWKKDKAHRGGPLQDDDGLDDVLAGRSPGGLFGARGRGRGGRGGGAGGAEGSRRLSKDKKYGFGGPKRHAKATDSKSLNDFSAFNPKKGKSFGLFFLKLLS